MQSQKSRYKWLGHFNRLVTYMDEYLLLKWYHFGRRSFLSGSIAEIAASFTGRVQDVDVSLVACNHMIGVIDTFMTSLNVVRPYPLEDDPHRYKRGSRQWLYHHLVALNTGLLTRRTVYMALSREAS